MKLLLVTGSTRPGSSNSAALRTIAELLPDAVVYEGLGDLPHFNPAEDHDPLPAAVTALRGAIAAADALVFCTPEYAGTLPGSFKNLLDWTVGGPEMDGRRATWLNVGAAGRGTGAEATLRVILGYVGAVLLPSAGARVPAGRDVVTADGRIEDPATRGALADAVATIAAEVRAA